MQLESLIIPAIIAGTVLLLFISLIWLISRKLQTCEMDEAIVRTGYGGPKVVIAGAIFVFSLFHRMQRVSLRTIKLDVKGSGTGTGAQEHAGGGGKVIRSSEMLPINIDAEIYVRVPPKKEFIMAAARTLGESIDPKQGGVDTQDRAEKALENLVCEKIQSALRGVCAQMTLVELHANHTTVVDQVTTILESDLQENGLELESVAIESINPEPIARIKEMAESGNVFDITAARAATEVKEREETERNKIEKNAEIARIKQDTTFDKDRLVLEQDLVTATETTKLAIENIKEKTLAQIEMFEAETNRDRTVTIEQSNLDANKKIEASAMELEIYQSECEKEKAVTSAKYEKEYHTEELERDRAIEMLEEEVNESIAAAAIVRVQSIGTKASESKKVVGLSQLGTEKEIAVAEVSKNQAREVREEEKAVAVANAQTEVARVETQTNEALALAAKADEAITTVRLQQKLYRETVVPEEQRVASALQIKLQEITKAEAKKTAVVLQAEGDTILAERQRDADTARGEGASALLALGSAEAESRRLNAEAALIEAEAELLDSKSVVSYLYAKNAPEMAKNLPLMVEAAFKPMENIDGMKIIQVNSDGGNGENGSAIGNLMKNAVQTVPLGAIVGELLSGAEGEQWKDLLQNAVGALGTFGKSEVSPSANSRDITSTNDS
jgi:flotillin